MRCMILLKKYIRLCNESVRKDRETEFNRILEEEVAGYRIIKGLATPIISENELSAIEQSIDAPYESVSKHMSKVHIPVNSDHRSARIRAAFR